MSLARPTEIMQAQEVEEVDEIGLGQRRSKDVVFWQCGEKWHLQCDCPHKETNDQVESMDGPNAYAGRSEQIIRINQPITVATRDNIYKQMGSQRTKANIYKAGYRKTRATLQEQQKINAAITSTLAAKRLLKPQQCSQLLFRPQWSNNNLSRLHPNLHKLYKYQPHQGHQLQ